MNQKQNSRPNHGAVDHVMLSSNGSMLEGAIASKENANGCNLKLLRQLIWRCRVRALFVRLTLGRLLQF